MSSPITLRSDVDQIPVAEQPATTPPPRPQTWLLKVIQAVTGGVFACFVLFHLAGNLKVYLGRDDFNHYAHWLRTILNPLIPGDTVVWLLRLALLAALALHVYAGLTIWVRARRARGAFGRRPVYTWHGATGRAMIWTGLILLCFIVFHLLDLTWGKMPVASKEFNSASPYDNLIYSFERPIVAGFYILTMVLLALHLAHGLWSFINDLGASAHRTRQVSKVVAAAVALVVVVGNMSMPIAVLAGVLTR